MAQPPVTRPFGAVGQPPGTLATRGSTSEPIFPVPGVPGGTLAVPVPLPGTRARGVTAAAGTGSYVSMDAVRAMGAVVSRGAGPAGSRAPEGLVYAGAQTPGVRSNGSLTQAIVAADIRNPYVAPFVLSASMQAGSTRVRG